MVKYWLGLLSLADAAAEAQAVPPKATVQEARLLVPALAGLVILFVAMLVAVWWSGSYLRRRAAKRFGATLPPADEWSLKPLPQPPTLRPPGERPEPPPGA